MSKGRNFIKKHFMKFCFYGSILSSIFFLVDMAEKKETIAEVPFEVRNELYYQGILDDNDYFYTYGRYTSSGTLMKKATSTDKLLDKYVTYEKLKKLESAEIHMSSTDDIKFLNKCPKVKTLYINDAEMLSDEDISFINNSKVEHIYLTFNYDNVAKIKENKFDISRLKKDVKINNSFYEFYNDLEQVTIYNYIINYDKDMFVDEKSYEHVKEIDDYLNNIIDEYKIDEGKDDLEKAILISNYICNSIDYDQDISKKINKYMEDFENKKTFFYTGDSKTKEYNYHSITSIINQDQKIKEGVCINYASLFDILCYKVGIKSRMVSGIDKTDHLGHAWNLVYTNNDQDFFDLTYYDSSEYGDDFLEEYFNTRDVFTYEVISDNLIRDIDKDYGNFKLFEEIEDLDKKPNKTNQYIVNQGLDSLPTLNKDLNLKKFFIMFLLGGFTSLIPNTLTKNKARKIKALRSTSKK